VNDAIRSEPGRQVATVDGWSRRPTRRT
jgi:hypothetical protein